MTKRGRKPQNNGNGEQDRRLVMAVHHLKIVKINEQNRQIAFDFVQHLSAEGLTKVRQAKYIYAITQLSRKFNNKQFTKITKKDVEKLMGELNNSDLSEWTKRDYRIILKRLMKYIRETESKGKIKFKKGQYPEEVEWLSSTMKKSRRKNPKQLLKIKDVKLLTDAMLNLRDKAYCSFLYESGARIGEILNIKIKDVEFDQKGAKVDLQGKTGPRKIRVIGSAPALSTWKAHHPQRNDNEAWFFCSLNHPSMGNQGEYAYFNKILRKAKERLNNEGIKFDKPVNPHHFRHSRATELAKKLTESTLCQYFGWEIGSREARTYVHLSGRDLDTAILALHGMADEEQKTDAFTPIKCPRCNQLNDPSSKFCNSCSLGLDEESILKYDQEQELALTAGTHTKELFNNPDFINEIIKSPLMKQEMAKILNQMLKAYDKGK